LKYDGLDMPLEEHSRLLDQRVQNYFFKLSSIADFIASSTLASAAAFATRTALFMASASERP
jgi:hypothetical protein